MGGTVQSLLSSDSGNNIPNIQNNQSAVQAPVVNEPARSSALQSPVVQGTPLANLGMFMNNNQNTQNTLGNSLEQLNLYNKFLR